MGRTASRARVASQVRANGGQASRARCAPGPSTDGGPDHALQGRRGPAQGHGLLHVGAPGHGSHEGNGGYSQADRVGAGATTSGRLATIGRCVRGSCRHRVVASDLCAIGPEGWRLVVVMFSASRGRCIRAGRRGLHRTGHAHLVHGHGRRCNARPIEDQACSQQQPQYDRPDSHVGILPALHPEFAFKPAGM